MLQSSGSRLNPSLSFGTGDGGAAPGTAETDGAAVLVLSASRTAGTR